MQGPGSTVRQWLDRGLGSLVPLFVVLLAVVALPGCPRVAGMAVSEDTKTVTELRPITQSFDKPGRYLLHQTDMAAVPCDTCEEHVDQIQQSGSSQTVVTVDVLPQAADSGPEVIVIEAHGRFGLALSSLPAGHVTSVPAPPPRAV